MCWHEKHYEVVIELIDYSKKFESLEEAREYANELFWEKNLGADILVVEVNPKASDIYERSILLFLYDGSTGEVKSFME